MSGGPAPRVYIDANILLYVIEGSELFRAQLGQLMDALDAGKLLGVTSDLTFAEVMVKPFASRNERYISAYRHLLVGVSALEVVPISREVLEQSAILRAEIGGKLADGIHVATAVMKKCSHFISEDAGIRVPAGLALLKTSAVPTLLASVQDST